MTQSKSKEGMYNQLNHCDDSEASCSCSGSTHGDKKVDLVVLLDSSGSMAAAATAVSAAAVDAVNAAAIDCPSDLRVTWLVVDSEKPGVNAPGFLGDITTILSGTPFTQSHQQYLEGIGATGPFKQDEAQPAGDFTYPGEEGADSIADICNFYDWRPKACRAIFYISDTALDGYSAFYDAAATNATIAATTNGVVLFAHKIVPGADDSAGVEASYDNLTLPTGGSAYHGPVDVDQYKVLVKNAICKACGTECKEVKLPVIEPCVSIAWGQSECDCFETNDIETVLITICNCYSNLKFANVEITGLQIQFADGTPVPLLPDGTPSVSITPVGPICFDDIEACCEGESNCISKEVVIQTKGARSGQYKILLTGIHYDIVLSRSIDECFTLTLCQD